MGISFGGHSVHGALCLLGVGISRNSSRSRPNSRLQERLAKAVTQRTESPRASGEASSRPDSPALRSAAAASEPGRTSIDSKASEPTTTAKDEGDKEERATPGEEAVRPSTESAPTLDASVSVVSDQPSSTEVPSMLLPSILTPSTESPRQSLESIPSRVSVDAPPAASNEPPTAPSPETLEADLVALQKTHEETLREHREEMHMHLERIDALQSKLTYLSQQLASSAKAASADSSAAPADKKLAEKDAQIAALMEEGQKLSKTEMKHLTTIKKMRTKAHETDREIAAIKQRLNKAEKGVAEQTDRAKRAEAAEKAAQEKLKIVSKIEKDLEIIRAEREEAGLTIAELRKQLNDALSRADDAAKRVQAGALEAEKRVTASLKEDIENLRIEKKLAEDRVKRELQEAREDASRQREKASVVELELRSEIAVCISLFPEPVA